VLPPPFITNNLAASIALVVIVLNNKNKNVFKYFLLKFFYLNIFNKLHIYYHVLLEVYLCCLTLKVF
jgi:hypothetical protein